VQAVQDQILRSRIYYKGQLYSFTVTLSVLCIFFTYSLQCLITPFAEQNLAPVLFWQMEWAFFLVGVSALPQPSFYRQVYFYMFIFLINLIERICVS
jgi:hypothetical protein